MRSSAPIIALLFAAQGLCHQRYFGSEQDLVDIAKANFVEERKEEDTSSFYKTCQSSCTDFSQGTKVSVELCDDTEV